MTIRNGTQTGAEMPDYTKAAEMLAFDSFPPALRDVLREAPFSVSAADMKNNAAVMQAIKDQGANAPTWLAQQLIHAYRKKILASS